eukprot:GHVR01032463.1.p1 GENE.GHVR01032463.1~~GHVR01032463.1.p1  ORF type:complete len:504 (+),score=85.65 GHVR01032463.1:23-1534(+)
MPIKSSFLKPPNARHRVKKTPCNVDPDEASESDEVSETELTESDAVRSGGGNDINAARMRKQNNRKDTLPHSIEPTHMKCPPTHMKCPTSPQSLWRRKVTTFMIRFRFSIMMITLFLLVLLAGHIYIYMGINLLTLAIYREILRIKRNTVKEQRLWLFYFLRYYFLVVTCVTVSFFLLFPLLSATAEVEHFPTLAHSLRVGGRHVKAIAFTLFLAGFIFFILSLRKFSLRYQFQQMGWVVLTNLVVVMQAQAQLSNMITGLVWFLLPAALVICNDTFAYVWGTLFGRHRLIRLSPNKTWEGFIGAFVTTLVFGVGCASLLQQWPQVMCPLRVLPIKPFAWVRHTYCDVDDILVWHSIEMPYFITYITGWHTLDVSNMHCHGLVLSVFASLIAPFGGFFASALKRAFKLKDFGSSIPGHGGYTDRFDCQLLMGSFTFMYVHSVVYPGISYKFARRSGGGVALESFSDGLQLITAAALQLPLDEQKELLLSLSNSLGIIADSATQ